MRRWVQTNNILYIYIISSLKTCPQTLRHNLAHEPKCVAMMEAASSDSKTIHSEEMRRGLGLPLCLSLRTGYLYLNLLRMNVPSISNLSKPYLN